jgi:hypothetical protein
MGWKRRLQFIVESHSILKGHKGFVEVMKSVVVLLYFPKIMFVNALTKCNQGGVLDFLL